jgi:excisionase family DNA binding protein
VRADMETMRQDTQTDARGVPTLEGLGAYISVKEAGRLLGMTVSGVHAALRRRRVPSVKLGNSVLIRASDLRLLRAGD